MCVVSFVGDRFAPVIPQRYPWVQPYIDEPWRTVTTDPEVSKEEFDALKREVEALRKLLKAAKEYDEETGQPDCEQDEKIALIRRLAEICGVDMSNVFGDYKYEYGTNSDGETYLNLTVKGTPKVI